MSEGYLYCRNCKTAFMYKGIGDQSHCVKCDENSVIEITKDVADELLSLNTELARLREERRWIPVSKNPKWGERYLISMVNEYVVIATFYEDYWKNDSMEKIKCGNVVGYMPVPLPQPPQECER